MDAARELAEVLDREKDAARRADVDALLALQADKRAALDRLRASHPSRRDLEPLQSAAGANLALLRHLVACLRGVLGADETVYGATGEARPVDRRPSRGRG